MTTNRLTRLAVVEDNATMRNTLITLIDSTPGYRCVCACDSAEAALVQIPQNYPDVVLMDIHLPGQSGIACTARLTELLPELQVIKKLGQGCWVIGAVALPPRPPPTPLPSWDWIYGNQSSSPIRKTRVEQHGVDHAHAARMQLRDELQQFRRMRMSRQAARKYHPVERDLFGNFAKDAPVIRTDADRAHQSVAF